MNNSVQFANAAVLGRFQPFHNEPLKYLLAAKDRCRHLWVGITRFLPSEKNRGESHRGQQTENPLTYFERVVLIDAALRHAGVSREEFTCVPFPIDEPLLLPHCLSTEIPCLTTLCEPWNEQKIQLLSECGYHVEVLYHNEERKITGQGIRNAIREGVLWESLVPEPVARLLNEWDLHERLQLNGRPE